LMSYYFLELLPIFVIFKHIGLISTFNLHNNCFAQ